MRCPYCKNSETMVKDSRPVGNTIKRRRQCANCGKRFSTYEVYETIPLMVVKKDNSRQKYDKRKIERGILQAIHKRPISASDIDNLLERIENRIFGSNLKEKEIKSSKIGDIVLDELKNIDAVAFIRFASIYNEFNDIDTFRRELDRLSGKNEDI